MKFIHVKMEEFVPIKRTVASNVLAEMAMAGYCALKKVYDAYITFDCLLPTNMNTLIYELYNANPN